MPCFTYSNNVRLKFGITVHIYSELDVVRTLLFSHSARDLLTLLNNQPPRRDSRQLALPGQLAILLVHVQQFFDGRTILVGRRRSGGRLS